MSTQSAVQQIRKDSWCVVENVVPLETTRALLYDLNRFPMCHGMIAPSYIRNGDWKSRALELASGKRAPAWATRIADIPFYIRPAVINDRPFLAPYLADARVMKVIQTLLGPRPCIASATLVDHEPETRRGPWHPGGHFTAVFPPDPPNGRERAIHHLVAHWTFLPFTRENGGILALPGSHRNVSEKLARQIKTSPVGKCPGEKVLIAPAGSVLIHDGRLWSAIAANPSDSTRLSLVVDYVSDPEGKRAAPGFHRMAREVAPAMLRGVFDRLASEVQPLFRYWLRA